MSRPLQFLQINMNKAGAAAAELHRTLPHKDIGILLLTEPPNYKNRVVTLPKGYRLFPQNATSNIPRAAILARPHLNCVSVDHLCHPDGAVVLLPSPLGTILVASIYLAGDLPVDPLWLREIFSFALNRQYAMIIGFDSNAHHTHYGFKTDPRGEAFLDLLHTNYLHVNNEGRTPTFDTIRGGQTYQSIIDITTSHKVSIGDWRVDTTYNGSDHNSITFTIPFSDPSLSTGRRWSKADWTLFTSTLSQERFYTPRIVNPKKLDNMVNNLYSSINKALELACPLEQIQIPKPYSHWYNKDLKAMSKRLQKQFARAKRVQNPEETHKFHKLQSEYSNAVKAKRKAAWRQHLTESDSVKEVARLNRFLQTSERHSINLFCKDDGTYTEPGPESIAFLAKTHFPTASAVTPIQYSSSQNVLSSKPLSLYKEWINESLIRKAFRGFQDKKSPGPDLLKPIVFKHFPPNVITFLMKIYKISVFLHYTPYLWKQTRVIFIPKAGKDSYDKTKSFRPISLSNYLLKTLERLCVWRVDQALFYSPIHENQHGFLPGRSTETAISDTVNYIERILFQKKHCVGVFLDISAAFDSISIEHVRDSLFSHGVEPDLVEWYYHYLSRRDLQFSLHGSSITLQTNLGFPQGGVASAKFWIIAFDPAIEIINKYGIQGTGYADDCAALYHDTRIDYAVLQLQKMLDELVQWGATCNLSFNEKKTVAVVFSRSKRNFNSYQLQLNGKYIPYSTSVKYLGLTLDKSLYWKEHISTKIQKANALLFKLKSITSKDWGPSHLLMRWAYLGIVRPMLTYGAYIWGHEISSDYIHNKLNKLNRTAMGLFSQVPKSTPNSSLEIMLDVAPLPLHITRTALGTLYRLHHLLPLKWSGTFSNKWYSTSHRKHWSDLVLSRDDLPPLDTDYDVATDTNLTGTRNYTVDLRSFHDTRHTCPSEYNIFTDGSKQDDQVGAGFCIYHHSTVVSKGFARLPDHSTVFQAELFAIGMAALALRKFPQAKYAKFHVDNQSALLTLDSNDIRTLLARDTIAEIKKLPPSLTRITFIWTRAHIGTKGNEHADELAKRGAHLRRVTHDVPPPLSYLKGQLLSFFRASWKTAWSSSTNAQPTKLLYDGPDSKKARFLLKLPKSHLNLLIKLITDHTSLRAHSHKIDPTTDPTCRLCLSEPETFGHLLTSCPSLRALRTSIFLDQPPSLTRWSIDRLLKFSLTQPITDLLRGFSDEDLNLDVA